jgi:hypothetical protein
MQNRAAGETFAVAASLKRLTTVDNFSVIFDWADL